MYTHIRYRQDATMYAITVISVYVHVRPSSYACMLYYCFPRFCPRSRYIGGFHRPPLDQVRPMRECFLTCFRALLLRPILGHYFSNFALKSARVSFTILTISLSFADYCVINLTRMYIYMK